MNGEELALAPRALAASGPCELQRDQLAARIAALL
jgi:hypothetical protein